MKKIAIITTHYANNYGALLQVFALQEFLKQKYLADVSVLAYYPKNYEVSWKIFNFGSSVKDKIYELIRMFYFVGKIGGYQRGKKNRLFRKKYLNLTQPYYENEELQEEKLNFDAYICGSDQIWNTRLKYCDPVFFLDFTKKYPNNIKKISYAASVCDPILENAKPIIKGYLENIDYISVRELSDVKQLETLTNKKIYHCADPTFLFKDSWQKYVKPVSYKRPYILCYFLSYHGAKKVVSRLKHLLGCDVIEININGINRLGADKIVWNADPFDFVSYIHDAAYVCTNSFHATVFSILFKKDYIVVTKGHSEERMMSLQEKLGLSNRIFSAEDSDKLVSEDLYVDYSSLDERINSFVSDSIDYLDLAIGN